MIILIFHDEKYATFQKFLAFLYDFLAKSGKQAKFWVTLLSSKNWTFKASKLIFYLELGKLQISETIHHNLSMNVSET